MVDYRDTTLIMPAPLVSIVERYSFDWPVSMVDRVVRRRKIVEKTCQVILATTAALDFYDEFPEKKYAINHFNTFTCERAKTPKIFLAEIDETHLREFLKYLQDRGLAAATIASYISQIKDFYNWCEELFPDFINRSAKVKIPRREPSDPASFTNLELERIFKVLAKGLYGDEFRDTRAKLLVELLFEIGLRRFEALNLCTRQIDFSTDTILDINGKGSHIYDMPLGPRTREALLAYLPLREDFLISSDPNYLGLNERDAGTYPLLVSTYCPVVGEPKSYTLSRKWTYATCKDIEKATGVPHIHPHRFRHSCADQLVKNDIHIAVIQRVLRHRSLASTQVYTKQSFHTAAQAMACLGTIDTGSKLRRVK